MPVVSFELPLSRQAISIRVPHPCSAQVVVIAASATRGGVTTRKRASMPKPMKTAKHKLNSAHVHGALIIAGFLGLVTGSWLIFTIAAGVLVVTSVQDGSIRL